MYVYPLLKTVGKKAKSLHCTYKRIKRSFGSSEWVINYFGEAFFSMVP